MLYSDRRVVGVGDEAHDGSGNQRDAHKDGITSAGYEALALPHWTLRR